MLISFKLFRTLLLAAGEKASTFRVLAKRAPKRAVTAANLMVKYGAEVQVEAKRFVRGGEGIMSTSKPILSYLFSP